MIDGYDASLYPGFTSLLDNKKILMVDGGRHLFGSQLIRELVDQRQTMNTMDIQPSEKSSEVPVTPLQRPATASISAAADGNGLFLSLPSQAFQHLW